MNQLTESFLEFLKPAYYVPESDKKLQASIQKVRIVQEGSGCRALVIAQVVRTVALAVFISAPYFFSTGTVNLFLNCVHINFERKVLECYKAGMQSLMYSVIATIYIAIGIFKPSVFMGFATKFPDVFDRARNALNLDPSNASSIRSEIDKRLQNASAFSSSSSSPSLGNDREDESMDGWEVLRPYASGPIGINTHQITGTMLEIQDFRIALDEYISILRNDFNIDLDANLIKVQQWLKTTTFRKNLMLKRLERALAHLLYPVDRWAREGFCYANAKEQREVYVKSLREVLATEQYQKIRREYNVSEEYKECRILIRSLCAALFLCEKHEFLRQLLQFHEEGHDRLHPNPKEIPAVTRENFAEVVMAKNAKVAGSPDEIKVHWVDRNKRMLYGALGIEDFLMTDLPFLRGKQVFINERGEERVFYYMRHPTPHVPNSMLGAMLRIFSQGYIQSGEAIAPEFEGMLEAIAERGESYLIQSHQRLNDSGTIENEDGRSQTLYRLQQSYNNFHVVFQAVEGDLFERKQAYAAMTTFAELKRAIKDSFYDKKNPNRLPYLLKDDEQYRNKVIDNLLNQVHQKIFGSRMDISFDGMDLTQPNKAYPNREWQEFILAFYIFQGDDLKFRLPNVKYFCTNCKNFFDRGGNRAMAEDRMHQEMSKREVTREHLEETIVNLVPVPLQSKGKAVIEHRLRPGLALADTLAKLSLLERLSLQEVSFNGYKPDRFEVRKKPHQTIIPCI